MDFVPASGNRVDAEVNDEHFKSWHSYWGQLSSASDSCGVTNVYGYETVTQSNRAAASIPPLGTSYGYCVHGTLTLRDELGEIEIGASQWFVLPGEFEIECGAGSRVVVSQRVDWLGMRGIGGPIERVGRLRYIDGCSDTLLAFPPVKGDPCLNHLHFPANITQTEHWHPSVRTGIVAGGSGLCETPNGFTSLLPGVLFHIPARGLHRFITTDSELDVIAYHPDSDWGPTDTDHPMINRTWIGDGQKIDNTGSDHATSELGDRWQRAIETT